MGPGRRREQEDAYVAELRGASDDVLVDAIRAALSEQRVGLAARLVGLLDDDYSDDPELARSYRAAQLMLLQKPPPIAWSALEDELERIRERRMARFRLRQRRSIQKPDPTTPVHRGRKPR